MKVHNSIRTWYENQLESFKVLQSYADDLIKPEMHNNWFYSSRIKEQESVALKLETGRFLPENPDDFLGCMIVVANSSEINIAEEIIKNKFDILERKPNKKDYTPVSPEQFSFDDLRLYVQLKETPIRRSDIMNLKFEIQIKTFLQHAWAIATHDLVYKTDDASWARQRIAYQIKAMLEHAEVSISEIERLSSSTVLGKSDKKHRKLKKINDFILNNIDKTLLPSATRRLTENIYRLIDSLQYDVDQFQTLMSKANNEGKGFKTLNLSPYGCVVQTFVDYDFQTIHSYMKDTNGRTKILISDEIDLPPNLNISEWTNAILIGSSRP